MENVAYASATGDFGITSSSFEEMGIQGFEPLRQNKRQTLAYHRRNPEEITAAIICAAKEGAKKTRILYRASLNHRQLNRYLAILTKLGLLMKHADTSSYRATEKGLTYTRTFEKFSEIHLCLGEQERKLQGLLAGIPKSALK